MRGRLFDVKPDEHSWLVGEVKIKKTGKNAGEPYIDDMSRVYLPNITAVAAHLFEFSLLKADAESLRELVQIAGELRREIETLFALAALYARMAAILPPVRR